MLDWWVAARVLNVAPGKFAYTGVKSSEWLAPHTLGDRGMVGRVTPVRHPLTPPSFGQ